MTSSLPGLDPTFGTYAPTSAQQAVIALARNSFLHYGDWRTLLVGIVMGRREGPIDTTFRGLKFRLNIRDNTTEQGMLFNARYNERELDFLLAHLKPGEVFVDVGANVGLYSLPLSRALGEAGRVIAVEPDPLARGRLEANVVANQAGNIDVVPYAVGDQVGEVCFTRDPRNLGHSRVTAEGEIRVPIKPLLDILTENGVTQMSALKVDVEGLEEKVLFPFFDQAPKSLWPKVAMIEKVVGRDGDTPVARMTSLGYRIAASNRSNVFLVLD